jgi:hypothetical protein
MRYFLSCRDVMTSAKTENKTEGDRPEQRNHKEVTYGAHE